MSIDPESVARQFHEAYERLAPSFGYKTREASAVPWADVPEANRRLMVAVAGEVAPLIAAQALRPAAEAKRRLYARLIANAPLLDVPFTDAPDQSPWTRLKADMHRLNRALGVRTDCPTCSGPTRETVGMVCQTCGTDYAPDAS